VQRKTFSNLLSNNKRILGLIVGSGLFQLLIYLKLFFLGNFKENILSYTTLFLVIFLIYLAICLIIFRTNKISLSKKEINRLVITILIFSMIFRSVMLFTESTLSTDVLRFAWDGRVLKYGVDPYAHEPYSAELDWLKNVPYFEAYDHKDEISPYPPFAQIAFLLLSIFSESLFGVKVSFSVLDIMNCILLAFLLHDMVARRYLGGVILYSWSPLMIIEVSSSGHMEPLPIFFILVSLVLLSKKRLFYSTLSFTLAIWSKIFPILLLPIYLKYLKTNSKSTIVMRYLIILIVISLCLYVPFILSSGVNVFLGLYRYFSGWFFNPSSFLLFRIILNEIGVPYAISRILAGIIFFVLAFRLVYVKEVRDLESFAYLSILTLGLSVMLAPAVFPWYSSWILIFCAVAGLNLRTLPWIILSGTAGFVYLLQYMSDVNFIHIALIEYVPVYLALVLAYDPPPFLRRK
jgi:alpha-1,6-mannosyltransferase